MQTHLSVVHFQRKPVDGNHSIERMYSDIRNHFPSDIQSRLRINIYPSRGFLPRLIDSFFSIFDQGDINHITGDIHYLTFFLRKNKTILTILDCVSIERLTGFKRSLFIFLWYWLPVKCSARIVVISESTKNELQRYISCDSDKIKIIYCPLSETFKFHQKTFNKSKPRILQIGTFENKNLPRLFHALTGIPCTLSIIGKLSNHHIQMLKKLNIDFENYFNLSDEDLLYEYVKCDLLSFISLYEGFGLPIIEANAVGRPVVTSNIFSMPEVAGNAALFVDPYNVEAMRAAFVELINNDRKREQLIENGLSNITRFNLKTISSMYVELYRDLYDEK